MFVKPRENIGKLADELKYAIVQLDKRHKIMFIFEHSGLKQVDVKICFIFTLFVRNEYLSHSKMWLKI